MEPKKHLFDFHSIIVLITSVLCIFIGYALLSLASHDHVIQKTEQQILKNQDSVLLNQAHVLQNQIKIDSAIEDIKGMIKILHDVK
jgi:hypothetical protein